jgi:hypothetical protein
MVIHLGRMRVTLMAMLTETQRGTMTEIQKGWM